MVAVLVVLSPKFQAYVVALLEVLVNVAVAPATVLVKAAVGVVVTTIRLVCVAVLLPAALLTVSVTEYVPAVL